MSSSAVGWALHQKLPAATKVILWGYAEHAGPDGKNSWISATTAAGYAGVGKGTAIRHIQTLVEAGYLRFGDQTNIDSKIPLNHRPVLYDLAMSDDTRVQWAAEYNPATDPRLASKAGGSKGGLASTTKRQGLQNATPQIEGQGLQNLELGVAKSTIQGLHQCNPNQELEPTTEQLPDELALVAMSDVPSSGQSFEAFWKVYPRKRGMGTAERAWAKAVKTTPGHVIIADVVRRLPWFEQEKANPRGDMRPYPGSWLNDKRWTDEVAAPPAPAKRSDYDYWDSSAR